MAPADKLIQQLTEEMNTLMAQYSKQYGEFLNYFKEKDDVCVEKLNKAFTNLQLTFDEVEFIFDFIFKNYGKALVLFHNHTNLINKMKEMDPNHHIRYHEKEQKEWS